MLAGLYAVLILGMAILDPDAAPGYEVDGAGWSERLRLLIFDILPMVSIVVGVILVIMFGIATPSESAKRSTAVCWPSCDQYVGDAT